MSKQQKRLPTKFRVLINYDKKIKPDDESNLYWLYKSLNDIEYRLDGYILQPSEEIGWFFGNTIYTYCFTNDRYHDLYVFVQEKYDVTDFNQYDYPNIKNIRSLLRNKKKPVRILKNTS